MRRGKYMKEMYKALDIAKWFLFYNNRVIMADSDADYISNLKLQKLLYYAQGSFLAIKDRPLFDDNLLAWEHGPVVNEVYQEYKKYGTNGIPFEEDYTNNISNEDEDLLKEVYKVFGKYSAWGLREMTHNETPWKETKRNGVISLESIKDYFKKNYVED